MAYGTYPYGSAPYGASEDGEFERNVVNVPVTLITVSSPLPVVGVQYQYTTRKYNALERRSPCPN